jgi:hypothetical protein
VAHTDLARQLAQGQGVHAALAHGPLRLLEQGGAQVAVVVRPRPHRAPSVTEVVVDIIVVSDYIVVYDYLEHGGPS